SKDEKSASQSPPHLLSVDFSGGANDHDGVIRSVSPRSVNGDGGVSGNGRGGGGGGGGGHKIHIQSMSVNQDPTHHPTSKMGPIGGSVLLSHHSLLPSDREDNNGDRPNVGNISTNFDSLRGASFHHRHHCEFAREQKKFNQFHQGISHCDIWPNFTFEFQFQFQFQFQCKSNAIANTNINGKDNDDDANDDNANDDNANDNDNDNDANTNINTNANTNANANANANTNTNHKNTSPNSNSNSNLNLNLLLSPNTNSNSVFNLSGHINVNVNAGMDMN
ncbi:NDT80/PhoG-like protein, partial [Reticulomyxa filosa]